MTFVKTNQIRNVLGLISKSPGYEAISTNLENRDGVDLMSMRTESAERGKKAPIGWGVTQIIAMVALVFLAGCTRSTPPADVEYDQSISPYHVVRRGDSISGIAQRYRMDRMELVRLNGLKTPYRIVIGQRLLVRPLAASARISKSIPDSADMPAVEPVDMGGVQVTTLKPLPGTDSAAVEPGAQGIPAPISQSDNTMNADRQDISAGTSSEGSIGGAPTTSPTNDEDTDSDTDEDAAPEPTKKPANMPNTPIADRTYHLPVQGKVVRGFKPGKNGNDGINISAPKGTPVQASNNGVVAHAGNQLRGFGNVVLVKHDNGLMSVYAHLDEVNVKRGDVIKTGQRIGTVGKSGTVKEPQLHFEIRKGTTPVDPNQYLG